MARMTVVERLYYQLPKENPFDIDFAYEEALQEEDEQPYQRTYKVDNEPVPLDHGWIEEGNMVHIKNLGEEPEQEVRLDEGGLFVPPNGSVRFYHKFTKTTIFPISDKPTKITVTVYPK